MDTTPSFRDLIEVLEDTMVFHSDAARSSMGDLHARHQKKVSCYRAMLNEVRAWEDRQKQRRSVPARTDPDELGNDSLCALIDRIDHTYGMQHTARSRGHEPALPA